MIRNSGILFLATLYMSISNMGNLDYQILVKQLSVASFKPPKHFHVCYTILIRTCQWDYMFSSNQCQKEALLSIGV